jgi:hypothetical protein
MTICKNTRYRECRYYLFIDRAGGVSWHKCMKDNNPCINALLKADICKNFEDGEKQEEHKFKIPDEVFEI